MDGATLTMLLTLAALLVGALVPTIWRFGQALATVKRSLDTLTPELTRTLEAVRGLTQQGQRSLDEINAGLPAFREMAMRLQDMTERTQTPPQGAGWGPVIASLAPVVLGALETWRAQSETEPSPQTMENS